MAEPATHGPSERSRAWVRTWWATATSSAPSPKGEKIVLAAGSGRKRALRSVTRIEIQSHACTVGEGREGGGRAAR